MLVSCLCALGRELTPRQRRLVYCGLSRTAFGWLYWYRDAVAAGEEWAETGTPPAGAERIAWRLADPVEVRRPGKDDWLEVARGCVGRDPRPDVDAATSPTTRGKRARK